MGKSAKDNTPYSPAGPPAGPSYSAAPPAYSPAAPEDHDADGPSPDMSTFAQVDEYGKVDISLKVHKALPNLPSEAPAPVREVDVDPASWNDCPPLDIVIMIVGSRGDVQPYLSLALELIKLNHHRVRIASHAEFASLVRESRTVLTGLVDRYGEPLAHHLQFFDIGGDPKELMAYMVKNPGLLPGFQSLRNGDIPSKRKMTSEMLRGCYRAMFCTDVDSGQSFAADAIIANPPAFAHIHIAEALGVPLHMSFTMPWTPTTLFEHPLANIRESNASPGLSNYLSYTMVDQLTWQGLGRVINKFRGKILGLNGLTYRTGPSIVDLLKIPWTYCWSESLVPKPKDWRENIDISGFYFHGASTSYRPDPELQRFLHSGPPPVYIGFGSIVIDDPAGMTAIIFQAVRQVGVRAVVSAGWAGLGAGDVPPDVFIVKGNVPHDWLFADGRVLAVCHHGGAGTAAIGLRNGLPSIVIPFFGDQKFWGEMVHSRGAGPAPIPYKHLTVDALAAALRTCLEPAVQDASRQIGVQMRQERGEAKGVDSFHRHLPLLNMRCDVDPSRAAIWWSEKLHLKLSGAAAGLLEREGRLKLSDLTPHRAREYVTDAHTHDPLFGTLGGFFHATAHSVGSVAQLFYRPAEGAVNTFWGIPKGSEVRGKGKVTNFSSGMKEGAKGVLWGISDAITGLVTEPIAGAKKEGAKGVLYGVGRSWVNFMARPSAGTLGLFVQPVVGMSRSAAARSRKSARHILRAPRTEISRAHAAKISAQEKGMMLARFAELKLGVKERKKRAARSANRLVLLPLKEEGQSKGKQRE
ncbi:hypothetical protein IAU60_006774 [Kwoniella sp. DSM 27419]